MFTGLKITQDLVNPAVAGVKYYGYYSPTLPGMARGKHKESDQDELKELSRKHVLNILKKLGRQRPDLFSVRAFYPTLFYLTLDVSST